ncbi:MAG: PE-PPE domain-containing protein [Candidatus Sericytochromatia bacterium]
MGGTGHPLSRPQDTQQFIADYVNGADTNYIAPSGLCNGGSAGSCNKVFAVYTPEQFRFDTGLFDMTFDQSVAAGQANLDRCIRSGSCVATASPYLVTADQPVSDADLTYVVYGYSQSAAVATREKRDLIANPPTSDVFFVLAANPNKPNGGILERFKGLYIPILGVTFNGATPTNLPNGDPTDMTTVDIARQYDGWADFPTNPLNLLADLNAAMGIYYLHGDYYDVGTPELQGQYGDTTYYMIGTPVLPLLMPLQRIPLVGNPLAVTLDPFLRVLVEAGYDRTVNPGVPTTAKWLYFPNPIKTLVNLVAAIPVGLDNLISTVTGNPLNRPFGTQPPNMYGVGGPDVYAGCGGGANCGNPTPYVAVDSQPQIVAAKLAAEPQGSDPKLNKDEVTVVDSKLPESTKTDNEQLTANTGNEQLGSKTDNEQLGAKTDNEQQTIKTDLTTKTDPPSVDKQDLDAKDPKTEPKPKPKPKPFNINLSLPGFGANEPKVRKPFQAKPPTSDTVPAPGGVAEKPADPKPAGSDPAPQGNTSESGTPAGAPSQAGATSAAK